MTRPYARRARRRSGIDQATLIILIAFIITACITTIVAITWARSTFFPSSQASTVVAPAAGKTAKANPAGKISVPGGPLSRPNDPTPAPWDDNRRVTLLFLGLDYRDWEEGDIPRTDSMILFSVDPKSKMAGMMSIPRDLWVDIPGEGKNKINTAYRLGELNSLPGGGPGLAMKTVEDVVGLPVYYYAMVDFNAFVRFIDEMGGLDMHIREEITIDPIGPGNTRKLEPGVQTLTGAEALAYARNRYEGNDDFDRSRRQQEVIMAIREQILQFDMLPTLIAKAPKLYQEISSGINTNLTLDQLVRLAMLATQVDEKNIKKGVIAPPLQVEVTTNPSDGQSILVPIPDQIRILRDQTFVAGAPAAPAAPATQPEPTRTVDLEKAMRDEKARVLVQNGTSTSGLASKAGEMLRAQGVNVIGEENAGQRYSTTTIHVYTGKQATVNFLIKQLGLKQDQVVHSSGPNPPADIVIILGSDWAAQQE